MDKSYENNLHKISGLTEESVREKFLSDKANELPSQKNQSSWEILINVLKEPMLLMLLVAGLIYLMVGEIKDALMLLTFIFVVIGITFYQEKKTERAVEALRNLSSPRALVVRDGKKKRVAGREVVKDDIIILMEGDRVPADAVLLYSTNLSVNESLLTGESVPVRKIPGQLWPKAVPGGDDTPFLFSGTLVTQGRGIARVTEIGINTQMGQIGKTLETIKEEDTLLKKETDNIIRNFAILGIFLCLLVIGAYGLIRGDWLKGLLSGLSLSMAMLPEEFSVVLLIFLTLGAWRMSKRKVLTRHTAAIETLGATTALCVDKTGTITKNSLEISHLYTNSKTHTPDKNSLPENFHSLVEYAILASQKDPFDPIEKEIKRIGQDRLKDSPHLHENWKLVREYPLSKELLALSHVWESPDKRKYVIASKGAPEAIADLCHLEKTGLKKLQEQITLMTSGGLRVLGVAKALFDKKDLPQNQHDYDFSFCGLLGFVDPVRENIGKSVKECQTAGIKIYMITGDYPGTAQSVSRKIGLSNPDNFITGKDLEQFDIPMLKEKLDTSFIFARVVPQQKLTIVDTLKSKQEIVAMTGDGVNDAPALKSAHIGIAMGERGTDVAREAADIVLLNDDFSSIVAAVRLGRKIFDNLKKAMAYIFAVHIPIAGMSLVPIFFNLPVVLMPAHIAFLELIIDPACSTVFEAQPEEKNIMSRPPRDLNKPLFDRKTVFISFLQGLSITVILVLIFRFALEKNLGEDDARTITFTALVIANLMLIITNLSWRENFLVIISSGNRTLLPVILATSFFLLAVLYFPFLRNLFHFSLLHFEDLFISVAAGTASIFWFELLKMINKKLGFI